MVVGNKRRLVFITTTKAWNSCATSFAIFTDGLRVTGIDQVVIQINEALGRGDSNA